MTKCLRKMKRRRRGRRKGGTGGESIGNQKGRKKMLASFLLQRYKLRASLIALLVKNPPVMQETPVRFLGQEDPLEKG